MTKLEPRSMGTSGMLIRRTASGFVILVLTVGCACLFGPHYPTAGLTRLLREDSTSVCGFTWTESGHIYYEVRCRVDSSRSGLWVMDAASHVSRHISSAAGDRLDVSGDTLLATMDGNNTIVVMDSLGNTRWRRDVERWVFALHLSSDCKHIYFSKLVGPMLLDLLRTTLVDSAPIETVMTDVGSWLRFEGDTALQYLDKDYNLIQVDIRTGTRPESTNAGGAWNPSVPDYVAIGERGDGWYRFMGRRATILDLPRHTRRTWEIAPYDTCDVSVSGLSPDGTKLLVTVTPFVPGDPSRPLDPELWIADLSAK